MQRPINRTTDARLTRAVPPARVTRPALPAPDVAEMQTGVLQSPAAQASAVYEMGQWALVQLAEASKLCRAAADVSAEIASMTADAARLWVEYDDLKSIRGGRPHGDSRYEARWTWLKHHLPDLERSIAHARGEWTHLIAQARKCEAIAERVRAAQASELRG